MKAIYRSHNYVWMCLVVAGVAHAQALPRHDEPSVTQKITKPSKSAGKTASSKLGRPANVVRLSIQPEATPVGAGWEAANKAYADYAKGLFALSAESARQAVAAEPENKSYRYLLVNALQGAGLAEETLSAARDAMAKFGPDETWLSVESLLLAQRAATVASEVYRSLERDDLSGAITFAQQAVQLAPDELAYRSLLVDLLMRAGNWRAADVAVTELLDLEPLEVSTWILRAVVRHSQGEYSRAVADFEHAFGLPDLDDVQHRWLRLIAVDSALKARDIGRAKEWLAHGVMQTGKDAEWRAAVAQRVAAVDKSKGAAGASRQNNSEVLMPVQRCRLTPYGRACLLLPGVQPAGAGYQAANAAYELVRKQQLMEAAQQARQALALEPGNNDYRQLLFDILVTDRQWDKAVDLTRSVVAETPDDLEWRKRLAGLLFDAGHPVEARAELQTVMGKLPADGSQDMDVAYLATKIQDSESAQSLYLRMADANRLKGVAWGDAAFSSLRLKMDFTALQFLRKGIDDMGAAPSGASGIDDRQLAEQIDVLRKASAEVSRRWGLTSSLTLSRELSVPGDTGLSSAIPPTRSTVVGAEAYWRPFGYRNGQLFEVFARGYATLSSSFGGPKGLGNGISSIGVRGKPWAALPVVFSAWRQLPLGVLGESDWVVQASYFQGWGTDVRTTQTGWWTGQLSAEWSRAIQQGETYAAAEARWGRNLKSEASATAWTLQPFVALKSEYNTQALDRSVQGLDVGVSVKRAFREDKYTAPMSTLELEWRHRIKQWGGGKPGAAIRLITSY